MSNSDSRVPRTRKVPGVEEPERLLRRSRKNASNKRQARQVGIKAQKRAPLTTGGEQMREASLCAVSDQIILEERLANVDTTPVAPIKSEQLRVRDAVEGIPVDVKEAASNLVFRTPTANQKGVDNHLLAALETLVVCTVHKVVNSSEFMSRFSDAVIDRLWFVALVAISIKLKHQNLVTKQIKIANRCRQFVEAGEKMDPCPVSEPSEGSDRPLNDISDDKTSPRACSIIKSVNELFADAVDYRNYRLIKKSAWYDDGIANELNKMAKKTAVQMKNRIFNG